MNLSLLTSVVIVILITRTTTVNIPATKPNLPISSAIVSNFYWRGVASASYPVKALILPTHELSPTTKITS